MGFDYLVLYVADVDATVAFYQQAFQLTCRQQTLDYAEMNTEGFTLAFAAVDLMRRLLPTLEVTTASTPGMQLSFRTPDLPQALRQAQQAGAVLVKPPETMPWGMQVAFVQDINGTLIELCAKV